LSFGISIETLLCGSPVEHAGAERCLLILFPGERGQLIVG